MIPICIGELNQGTERLNLKSHNQEVTAGEHGIGVEKAWLEENL